MCNHEKKNCCISNLLLASESVYGVGVRIIFTAIKIKVKRNQTQVLILVLNYARKKKYLFKLV